MFQEQKKKKAKFIRVQWARQIVVQNKSGDIKECGLGGHIKEFGFYLKCNGKSAVGNRQKSYIIRLMFVKILHWLLHT